MRIHIPLSLSLLALTLACQEGAEAPNPELPAATLAQAASTLVFTQLSAGNAHTCGVTSDNRLYCWGANNDGELGDGTTTNRPLPVPVGGSLRFRQVSAGGFNTCGVTTDNRACGVTTGNRVFCWGSNRYGAVGDNSTALMRLKPVPVADTRQYRQVDVGPDYSCAVTLADRAFCWGQGLYGRLGNGEAPKNSRYPRPVSGGLSVDQITTGDRHACAETTGHQAYCWGDNSAGSLGDGTTIDRLTPVAVVGGLSFSQVIAGGEHTCGRTSEGRAYCWGFGTTGALGTGTTDIVNPVPLPVAAPM